MKTYVADRLEYGCEVYVVSDNKRYPLALHLDIRNHSPTGFNWGYRGSGAAQLSLAILADYFGPLDPPKECPYCGSKMQNNKCSLPPLDGYVTCGYDFSEEDQWAKVQTWYQIFKEDIISILGTDKWMLQGEQIDKWFEGAQRRRIIGSEGNE